MVSPENVRNDLAGAIAYLEKKPRLFDAACREIPDLFIARVFSVQPARLHIRLQRHLDAPGQTKTIGMPRNHGKTTQVSIGRIAWEIGRNPNIRVQIVQDSKPDASKTVGAIKETIESEVYQRIFPNVKPSRDEWGKLAISVQRSALGRRDATVTAQPIFGAAGQRADILLLDDVENFDNSIRQEGLRQQVKDAYVNTWLPTLEPGGREWRIGTPWHVSGIMMDWRAEAEADGTLFWEPCDGTERSPWPEKFPPAELRRRRRKMGEIAYARAFQLRAITGEECIFDEDDLRAAFRVLPEPRRIPGRVRWAAMDLAFSDAEQRVKRGKHSADYAVLAIADIGSDGHVWMVRVLRIKSSYPEFKRRGIAECQRLGVQRAKIESNGPQKGFRQDLGKALAEVGISHIRSGDRDRDKVARAMMQQAVVEQGRFHLRTAENGELLPDMQVMFDELRTFPFGDKDDCVDTAVDLMAEARITNSPAPAPSRALDARRMRDIEQDIDEGEEPEGSAAYARWIEEWD